MKVLVALVHQAEVGQIARGEVQAGFVKPDLDAAALVGQVRIDHGGQRPDHRIGPGKLVVIGRPETGRAAIDAVIGSAEFQVLAFGHVHVPSVRLWRGRLLVNVASVGLPMDGDPRAAYSVMTWAGGGWSVSQYRVEYDVQRVARLMRRNGLPRGRHFAERLLAASYG